MKKIILFALIVLLAACEADPTPVLSPPLSAATAPTATVQGTSAPGVTQSASPRPAVTPSPTTRRGPGGAITIAGVGNPSRQITALPDFVSSALFDSLLNVDPRDGHLLPGLAERWQVSADSKTFIFTLRDDVVWHDGTPFSAEDVVFTLQTMSDPDVRVALAADFGPIEEITASDPRTVRVTFSEAYCAALTYIGTMDILPKHRLEDKSLANVADDDLIGTGPLVLKTWADDALYFTRNPNYWNGAPQIIDWKYETFPTERAAVDAVSAGRADLVTSSRPLVDKRAIPMALNEFYALAFNTKRPPLDDVSIRRALSSGLNRPQLASALGVQQTSIETSLLEPFWASPESSQPEFNKVQARALLASRGWRDTNGDGILDKDGKPLEVTLWLEAEDPHSEITAQQVRAQLADIGVSTVLKMTDRTLFLTRVFLQEYDLALVHFNIPLDPDQHYFWGESEDEPGFGLNVTGYSSPEIEQAIMDGSSIPRCDMTGRKKAYAPLFERLAQDTPMLFLFAPIRMLNFDDAIAGINPSSFAGEFWNLIKWQAAR